MNKKIYLYEFTVQMCGWGSTAEEAWQACKDNFDIDDEPLPEYEIIDGEETP